MFSNLSVIIPSYNRAILLGPTVKSILHDPPGEVEVIVVDDGSTDNTAEVAGLLGPSVRYLRQDNAGPAVARNTGFAASRGKYVSFLDSDDHWAPGAASRLLGVLERHEGLALAFGDAAKGTPEEGYASVVATFGGEAFTALPGEPIETNVRRLERRPFFKLLSRRNVVFLGSLILRREVVEQSGGFDPDLFGGEDWEFVMRLAARHEYAYCEGDPVAYYLQHPGGISRDLDQMEREFAKALRRVSRQPGLDAADLRWVQGQAARQEFEYAYRAYDRNDLAEARRRFGLCLKSSPTPRNLGLWAASHLPAKILGTTRRFKRGLLG